MSRGRRGRRTGLGAGAPLDDSAIALTTKHLSAAFAALFLSFPVCAHLSAPLRPGSKRMFFMEGFVAGEVLSEQTLKKELRELKSANPRADARHARRWFVTRPFCGHVHFARFLTAWC